MKLKLDYNILVDDKVIDGQDALAQVDSIRDDLDFISSQPGALILELDGQSHCEDIYDPIVRLAYLWIRKIPWVISGDTETVALRDSEHCFAFIPAGDSVELSFFTGSEAEIEDYVVEPVTVRLNNFVETSIEMADQIIEFVKAVDDELLETDETVKDLVLGLDEARRAWKEHQLHQRR